MALVVDQLIDCEAVPRCHNALNGFQQIISARPNSSHYMFNDLYSSLPLSPRMILRSSPFFSRHLRYALPDTNRRLCRSLTTLAISSPPPSPSPASSPEKPLDVPLPRYLPPSKALLLLQIPLPPTSWPARLELSSSLLASTAQSLKAHNIPVNAIYDGVGTATAFPFSENEEVYPARLLYPDGRSFTFPNFRRSSLSSPDLRVGLAHEPSSDSLGASLGREEGDGKHEILVCTHGARDCRCSDRGSPLVDALRKEIGRRGVEGRVGVREIAHVGGHK